MYAELGAASQQTEVFMVALAVRVLRTGHEIKVPKPKNKVQIKELPVSQHYMIICMLVVYLETEKEGTGRTVSLLFF